MMDSFWQMKDAQEDDHQYWWESTFLKRTFSRNTRKAFEADLKRFVAAFGDRRVILILRKDG